MALSIKGAGARDGGWTLEEAEGLIESLTGVISARMVGTSMDSIDEIHVLTTREVSAKQTVRNVESALLAQIGMEVDHRKISVARTSQRASDPDPTAGDEVPARFLEPRQGPGGTPRLLFMSHELESDGAHRARARVVVEWDGDRIVGQAQGTDLPRTRLEILAKALLAAVEELLDGAASGEDDSENPVVAFSLDGVKVLEAFDRRYVLVGVHALQGRHVAVLSGSAPVDDALEKSVILASLQATDRWVRGRL